jgi:hypothetical protein
MVAILCMTLMGCAAKPEQFTHSSATQKPIRVIPALPKGNFQLASAGDPTGPA